MQSAAPAAQGITTGRNFLNQPTQPNPFAPPQAPVSDVPSPLATTAIDELPVSDTWKTKFMHVVVSVAAGAPVFFVGDIDAAGKAYAAVADHDFAVGAVVGYRTQPPAYTGVVEERDMEFILATDIAQCA